MRKSKKLNKKIINYKNSKIFIFAFVVSLFQITAYKYIWSLEVFSRLINLILLSIFVWYLASFYYKSKLGKRLMYLYVLPGFLIALGLFINVSYSAFSNTKILNQYASIISWVIYLSIPIFVIYKKINVSLLWKYFNLFMTGVVSLSIVEYFLIFFGYVQTRLILTSGGPFLAGFFSMLYGIEAGNSEIEIHYRFYASFMEPGTLAMFLLPVIAYTFIHSKYFNLAIYLIAMYLTDSLGGLIGLFCLIPLLFYLKYRRSTLKNLLLFFIISLSILLNYEYFKDRYEKKGASASVRENSALNFVANFPLLVLRYPFGLPRTELTSDSEKNRLYSGSNFALGTAYMKGGFIAFIGYSFVILISLAYSARSFFHKGLDNDEKVVVASLFCMIPFIFQRATIWDSSIFAFLYCPYLIVFLKNTRGNPPAG